MGAVEYRTTDIGPRIRSWDILYRVLFKQGLGVSRRRTEAGDALPDERHEEWTEPFLAHTVQYLNLHTDLSVA